MRGNVARQSPTVKTGEDFVNWVHEPSPAALYNAAYHVVVCCHVTQANTVSLTILTMTMEGQGFSAATAGAVLQFYF